MDQSSILFGLAISFSIVVAHRKSQSHSVSAGCGGNARRTRHVKHMKIDLIDVRRRCIVPADTSHWYCVLSYVWGCAKVLRTTKRTRKASTRPGKSNIYRLAPIIEVAKTLT
jgi:hypothetical protein